MKPAGYRLAPICLGKRRSSLVNGLRADSSRRSAMMGFATRVIITQPVRGGRARRRRGRAPLPEFLATVSRRFATPVAASIIVGLLIVGLTWVYLLATSVQNAFNDVIAVTGQLFAIFYIMTALATIVYYRRRVLAVPGTR